jgi:hypothetical protein
MILLCLIVLVIFVSIISGLVSNMQSTTLYVGKKIAPKDTEHLMSRGLQDAITPKLQDTGNMILPICYIAIFVLGTIEKWYLGAVLLIVALILGILIKIIFIPKKLSFYVKYIIYDLYNRSANYNKKGDKDRAEAAKETGNDVVKFLDSLDPNTKVPDFAFSQMIKNG